MATARELEPTTSRSPSTAWSATCTRSRSSARTARSTGTAARRSTRRACSARSSTRTRAASTRCARRARTGRPSSSTSRTRTSSSRASSRPDGVGEVQDFMPIEAASTGMHRHRLIRRVVVVRGADGVPDRGAAALRLRRAPSTRSRCTRTGCCSARRDLTLALEGAIARTMGSRAAARARAATASARRSTLARRRLADVRARARAAGPHLPARTPSARRPTRSRRRSATGGAGSAQSRYRGRWREMVTARR